MSTSEVPWRLAAHEDCEPIWRINNEDGVRAQSIEQAPIPLEDHRAWFARALESDSRFLYVAPIDGEVMGVVRLDLDGEGAAVISIALAASSRGRGLGRRLIARGCEVAHREHGCGEVIAMIRPTNAASLKAFGAAGFIEVARVEQSGVALVETRWSAP